MQDRQVNQAYATLSGEVVKRAGVEADMSPVQELLARLNSMTEDLHNSMTRLEMRLDSVRASKPTGDGTDKPCATLPTLLEQRLFGVLDGLERLHRRIETTREELRI